jgi:hypothetical protein
MALIEINGNGTLNGGIYLDPQLQSVAINEDFIAGALTGTVTPGTATNSGAVAFSGMTGRNGVVSCTTGTVSAAGACALGTNANTVCFSSAVHILNMEIYLVNLSDGTETFTVLAGYGDVLTAAAQTDGVFFRYTHGENSGNWTLVCETAGVEVTLDSGVAVAATTWINLRIETYGSSAATFYINNVNVGTITTGIPTSTDFTGVNVGIYKSVGTSTRALRVDWIYMYSQFIGSR